MHACFSAWRPSPALVLESFEVSLDHQAHLLEPLWHCMEILALVLPQNSHLSPMPHCCWFWSAWGSCKLLCGRNKWEQAEVAVRKESTCKSTRPSSSPHLKTEVMSFASREPGLQPACVVRSCPVVASHALFQGYCLPSFCGFVQAAGFGILLIG